jgi:hypothetical protein
MLGTLGGDTKIFRKRFFLKKEAKTFASEAAHG